MENDEIKTYFTTEALARFASAQGKTVEKVVCHLWQNKSNPGETVEVIDNVELQFTDKQKLTIGCNADGDGLDALEYNYKNAAIALEKEFEGKIRVYAIDASSTKMWTEVIGKTLKLVKIEKENGQYKANALLLDFETEKREIEINPLDGIIIDYYDEEGVYQPFVDDDPVN
ncbi:MAG: hypothetical protein H0W73_09610 [Bacteroidetes bacterium]|nr:hypothetical protein [Bacteroidota bacterium]